MTVCNRYELFLPHRSANLLFQLLFDFTAINVNFLFERHKFLIDKVTKNGAVYDILKRLPGVVAVVEAFPCNQQNNIP